MEKKDRFKAYRKHFSEAKFWNKLRSQARRLGIQAAYAALLLFYAYRRPETPTWSRSIILGVLGYFLAPLDFIPDLTPLLGYTDDLSVLLFGLATIAVHVDEEVKEKARARLHTWFDELPPGELKQVEERL